MPTPLSATVGNFGNAPKGILRNPGWTISDLTLARRFSVPALGRDANARVQLQLYNIFNSVQFTRMTADLQFRDDPNIPGTDSLLLNTTNPGRFDQAFEP